MFDVETLKAALNYNPETGEFTWRKRRNSVATAGSVAGTVKPDGYRRIQFDGGLFYAGRLAWFYVYGVWPANQIDHIDRDPSNDRIGNLREATASENQANKAKRLSASQYRGVIAQGRGWRAYVTQGGRKTYLGHFSSKEDAAAAYDAAASAAFGGFAQLNKATFT